MKKYSVLVPQVQLENIPTSHEMSSGFVAQECWNDTSNSGLLLETIQWFHAYKSWNAMLNSGTTFLSLRILVVSHLQEFKFYLENWSVVENVQWFHACKCGNVVYFIKSIWWFHAPKCWKTILNCEPLRQLRLWLLLKLNYHIQRFHADACWNCSAKGGPLFKIYPVVSCLPIFKRHLEQWSLTWQLSDCVFQAQIENMHRIRWMADRLPVGCVQVLIQHGCPVSSSEFNLITSSVGTAGRAADGSADV